MSTKKLFFVGGVACLAIGGANILLEKLGIIESPETRTVNADYKSDIAWSSKAWDGLNRQTFAANNWNKEHVTRYIILQTIASSNARAGVYNWMVNFYANVLTGTPTDADIQQAIDYINNTIYCQMELSAIIRDTQNFYPNWDVAYFVNQTWWAKWLDASNTTLVPLFNCIHALPNYINLPSGFNNINTVKQEVKNILNSRTKI